MAMRSTRGVGLNSWVLVLACACLVACSHGQGDDGEILKAMKRRAERRLHSLPRAAAAADGGKMIHLRQGGSDVAPDEDQRVMREKLGLSLPKGGEGHGGGRSKCNETAPCEQCSEQSMQDQAEYCMGTGWRKVISCLSSSSPGKQETHFVSCEAGQGTATGPWAVAQMELMCAVMLTASIYFIKQRKRMMEGKQGGRAYTPMTSI